MPPDTDLSHKEMLVLMTEDLTLFTDERGAPYVRLPVDGHLETLPVAGRHFRSWLAHQFNLMTGKVPAGATLKDALQVVEGRALFGGGRHRLSNRLARWNGFIWLDMADEDWRAVRIGPKGWKIEDNPPPLFRRYAHQEAQVEPEPGGELADVLPLLNISDEDAKVLLLVWLVVALVPDIPRAVVNLYGPQGSAKSMLTRLLRNLIDPSAVPIPRFPRSDAEMAQVLDHNCCAFFDNLSDLNQHRSDTLCRAVTGDGFSKRKLYSDDDDVLYQFRRLLVLNGINVPATRPDLLDRSILVNLKPIRKELRREERELIAEFDAIRPTLVGAMLDALSQAMHVVHDIKLTELERMADWTRWGCAAAEALGIGQDRFLGAYRRNRVGQNREALGSHPVGAAVLAFMEDHDEWIGQPAVLLEELEKIAEEEKIDMRSKLWPGSASWLSKRLAEVETNLTEAGIMFSRGAGDERRIRLARDGAANAVGGVGGVQVAAMLEVPPDATTDGTDGIQNGDGIASDRNALDDSELHATDATDAIFATLHSPGNDDRS